MSPALRLGPGALALALLLGGCAEAPPLLDVPAALDFGSVPVGGSATRAFTVTNIGDRTVAIDLIGVADGGAGTWDVDAPTTDLFPGSATRVLVTFTPDIPGPHEGTVEIVSDDPASAGLGVRLLGTGAAGGNGFPGDGASPDPDDGADSGAACGDHDGDGHDACDDGGDCDDTDPTAFPVVVDPAAAPGGDGSVAAPFATVDEAVARLDATCREVVLADGTHTVDLAWDRGALTIRGGDADRVAITPPPGARAFTVGAGGALLLRDLTLTGARPVEGDGGALRVEGGIATLERVRAVDNHAPGDGGAVAVEGGALTLTRVTFTGNTAGDDGGAVHLSGGTLDDAGSDWTGNVAGGSGGALAARGGTVTVTDARFAENDAGGGGGAISVREVDEVALERLTLYGNAAEWRGGGLYVSDAAAGRVRNLVVQDNRAEVEGGGIAVGGATTLLLANTTIVGGEAEGEGGGLWIRTEAAGHVDAWSNVVAHAEGRSGVWVASDASATVAYTLGYGDDDALEIPWHADGGGNLVADPRFTVWTDDRREDDDLSLGPDSPARDSGPPDGEGPDGYRAWADPDGTPNDRGHTGGPGAR